MCVFWGEANERKAGQTGSLPCASAQTHTPKHAPAHLFPLTGEERDGSPHKTRLTEEDRCVPSVCVCEGVGGGEAEEGSYNLHQSLKECLRVGLDSSTTSSLPLSICVCVCVMFAL